MPANKYIIVQNRLVDNELTIPIEMDWSMTGQQMALDEYEEQVVEKVLGKPYDFEINRFSHAPNENQETRINYLFNFYSGGTLNDPTNWVNSYISEGFTTQEIFYFANSFSKSFFKLDFYDSDEEKTQKNYVTIILPTQQGLSMSANMQSTIVNIKKPNFILDFVGDKEGFFLYWLKSREFLNIDTFYMTAKFYNAKKSGFTKMMNRPQSDIIGNKYVFDGSLYFYYKVVLDYQSQTYKVYDIITGDRVGITSPIKWFEYVNPE